MVQLYSWLHSTFKDISNDTSHAQIRVKTKKLWPRQVGQSFLSHSKKLCRDIENYVTTQFSVATEKLCGDTVFCYNRETMSQHRKLCRDTVFCCNRETMSRHNFLCHDIKTCVATRS